MLLYLVLFILAVTMTFTGKAIADIVSDSSHWYHSIFSKYKIDGFWGSKERTWVRKHKCDCIKFRFESKNQHLNLAINTMISVLNGFLQYLFSTLLVWTTDIWHAANLMNRIGVYLAILFAILVGIKYCHILTAQDVVLIVGAFAFLNTLGFHVMYTYVLRKKLNLRKK